MADIMQEVRGLMSAMLATMRRHNYALADEYMTRIHELVQSMMVYLERETNEYLE